MGAQPLPDHERLRRKEAMEDAYREGALPPDFATMTTALAVAAERLGMRFETLKHWVLNERALKERGEPNYLPNRIFFRDPAKPRLTSAPTAPPPSANQEEMEALKTTLRRREDDIKRLQKMLTKAEKEREKAYRIRDEVFKLTDHDFATPEWVGKASPHESRTQTPAFWLSDMHIGEVVKPDQVNGINEYNTEIAIARAHRYIDAGIAILEKRQANYDGAYLLLGGDDLSGDIHDELRETNDARTFTSIQLAVDLLVGIVQKLADHFGRVHVVRGGYGNHGRTTKKPQAKDVRETNVEHILTMWLMSLVKDDDRISFTVSTGIDACFDIQGWSCVLTHGDKIGSRGGQGFIGPSAPIARGFQKVQNYYLSMEKPIKYVLGGHFHFPMQLPWAFWSNALIGYSEYARDNRFPVLPPSQWLLIADPKWGIQGHNIYVEPLRGTE